jgi:hypothetical protein
MCHNTPQVCQCNPKKLLNVNGVLEQAGYVKKKEWVGLTDEEVWQMSQFNCGTRGEFAKAIEAKLKEKNSG